MSFEIIFIIAAALGRILVLPVSNYLLSVLLLSIIDLTHLSLLSLLTNLSSLNNPCIY